MLQMANYDIEGSSMVSINIEKDMEYHQSSRRGLDVVNGIQLDLPFKSFVRLFSYRQTYRN